ncbi:hypothetical protein RhiirC2_802008 [Rhizophagus irregularis]|uniref:ATP-dependent DNA helicase RecQ zinc-binding domain-containing protein n=1 Tax=Rhizophagus irregularis TaxID=588596 RepID=A0A2N1M1U5_9GLOM|nr:hypothetical protein RhiirC2_802008 [Rhizophagus irregularis]
MSITNLIQEACHASRDGNTATNVIFYSKKDVRINYSIVAEHRETVSIIEEQRLINKLNRVATKIFEPDEVKLPVCGKCDNCINQIANKPKLLNGKEEIKKLEVVEYLTQERNE